MKKCKKCSLSNAESNKFCFQCGNPEFADEGCPKCGGHIVDYYKYCPQCCKKVEGK